MTDFPQFRSTFTPIHLDPRVRSPLSNLTLTPTPDPNDFRHTALYVAAKRNRQDTVKILLAAKANPNVSNQRTSTRLSIAS